MCGVVGGHIREKEKSYSSNHVWKWDSTQNALLSILSVLVFFVVLCQTPRLFLNCERKNLSCLGSQRECHPL